MNAQEEAPWVFRGKGQLARSWDRGSMRCFFMSVSGRRHGNAAVASGQLVGAVVAVWQQWMVVRSWQRGSSEQSRDR